jgi:hypothetical protein
VANLKIIWNTNQNDMHGKTIQRLRSENRAWPKLQVTKCSLILGKWMRSKIVGSSGERSTVNCLSAHLKLRCATCTQTR